MLSLILGPPRSGKTYKAVKEINDEYKKHISNSSKYRYIYCNIGGFQFERFDGFVKKFDKLNFLEAVQHEYTLNKQCENGFINVDDDYDSYALKNGIYKDYHHCLIVLDEAYNVFDKKFNDSLGRFLSYHGHFGIDVVFLLQSKRQTNREYLVHTELMYVAQPSGKRLLSKLFRYKVYSTCEAKRDNLIKTDNLGFDPKISEIYNSGSTQIYKSYATGKIFMLIGLAFALYLGFKVIGSPKLSDDRPKQDEFIPEIYVPIDKNTTLEASQHKENNKDENLLLDERRIYEKITCFPTSCKFRSYNLNLTLDSFLPLLADSKCTIVLTDKKSSYYIDYYVSCPVEFIGFLSKFSGDDSFYKGSQNENYTKNSDSFIYR